MDIRQWRTVISQRQETNKLNPRILSAYCPKGFPGHNTIRGDWVRLCQIYRVKEMELSFGAEARWLEFTGQSVKGKRAVPEEILGICQGSLLSVEQELEQCTGARELPTQSSWKDPPKRKRVKYSVFTRSWEKHKVSIHHSGYSHINEMFYAIKWRHWSRGTLCYTGI